MSVVVPPAVLNTCTLNVCVSPTLFTALGVIVIPGWQSWNWPIARSFSCAVSPVPEPGPDEDRVSARNVGKH